MIGNGNGWIPCDKTLRRKAEVVRIAELTGATVSHVVGVCMDLWSWADDECIDGHAPGVTVTGLSRVCHDCTPEFASAMQAVGWLIVDDSGVTLPGLEKWQGGGSKKRKQGATERKRRSREKQRDGSGSADVGRERGSGQDAGKDDAPPRRSSHPGHTPVTPPSRDGHAPVTVTSRAGHTTEREVEIEREVEVESSQSLSPPTPSLAEAPSRERESERERIQPRKEKEQPGRESLRVTPADRPDQAAPAQRLIDHYQAATKVPHTIRGARLAVVPLLAEFGVSEEDLRRCIDGYAAWCEWHGREPRFRECCRSFFEGGTWEQFKDGFTPPPGPPPSQSAGRRQPTVEELVAADWAKRRERAEREAVPA